MNLFDLKAKIFRLSGAKSGFEVLKKKFYFTAKDGVHGLELWKSDGTTDGTVMVKDIYKGYNRSDIQCMTVVDGTLFFTAKNSEYGSELWRSDGTANGTVMVKDIFPGAGGCDIKYITVFNNTLYFHAKDSVHGSALGSYRSGSLKNHNMLGSDSCHEHSIWYVRMV